MSKIKLERISSQILREVSNIIHTNVRSKLLKNVTLTGIELSNDLSVAKLYYTFLGDYEEQDVIEELKKASSFLRNQLADRIEIRHTPELRFQFDKSIEYGSNIERILNNIKNNEEDSEAHTN